MEELTEWQLLFFTGHFERVPVKVFLRVQSSTSSCLDPSFVACYPIGYQGIGKSKDVRVLDLPTDRQADR